MDYFLKSDRRSGKDRRSDEVVSQEIQEKRSRQERRSGKDWRRKSRLILNTNCPTAFTIGDQSGNALMMNLNDLGAMFRVLKEDDSFTLVEGQEHEYNIQTPYGKSICRGRITWSKIINSSLCWGIEFTHLSEDAKDPLLCLMDSPF